MKELLIACGWKNADTYDREWAELPNGPGIYAVVGIKSLMPGADDAGNRVVFYVGLATNLRRRLSCHPRVKQAYSIFEAVQRWHFAFDGNLLHAERYAIKLLDPISDQRR